MIINSAPQNEAVMSNVGEIGEFRIRNSAKAFNILSSGLYANKIRAIVRELSCNAVDSHVAAGKQDTPFDVHLPNTFEPWFAIRDYGTGLSHDQVTQIYTTYFESTKTASNEFIGALGLGSKSPFSYTDNFTVTAVQNGKKGIYSAFINEAGVPSIAKMMDEETTDPNGVEVKFSVNDRYDFSKFSDECAQVYRYFKLRPVVSGDSYFEFRETEYETRDIIPGVHSYLRGYRSVAIMGNIAYPIEMPNVDTNLGDLRAILNCGLEMHFDIGELDFQASREGLSYIPQTIASIKRKLEAVNEVLTQRVADEANAIRNMWARAEFLHTKSRTELWSAAVCKYVRDTKFRLLDVTNSNYLRYEPVKFSVEELAKRYNISIAAFRKNAGYSVCNNVNAYHALNKQQRSVAYYDVPAEMNVRFVVNDTKVGASERARNHFRNNPVRNPANSRERDVLVYVLNPAKKDKEMNTKAFFKALMCPPEDFTMLASSLDVKERKVAGGSGIAKNVTIMRLEERNSGGFYRSQDMVWRDAGKADSFDASKTYYYLPLSGYNVISDGITEIDSVKEFARQIERCGISEVCNTTIYGVRKADIEFIKTQKNWVNIQTFLRNKFTNITIADVVQFVSKAVDANRFFKYNADIASKVNAGSVYLNFIEKMKQDDNGKFERYYFEKLCSAYGGTVDFESEVVKLQDEYAQVRNAYPLLAHVSGYSVDAEMIAQYVNLIDSSKGV